MQQKTKLKYQQQQQSHSQRHSAATINFNDQKSQKGKTSNIEQPKLSLQDKKTINRNGSLILDFISCKIQIMDCFQKSSKGQNIIDLYQKQGHQNKVTQIKQLLQYLQSQITSKYMPHSAQRKTMRQMNNLIYDFLIQMNQFSQSLKQKLESLNKNQLQTSRVGKCSSKSSNNESLGKSKLKKLQSKAPINNRGQIKPFKESLVNTYDHYVIGFEQGNMLGPQSCRYDSLDGIDLSNTCRYDSLDDVNLSNLHNEAVINEQYKSYFYSFIISLSATNQEYHNFLNSLFAEFAFDDKFPSSQVQQAMVHDRQYCIRMLQIALKNKFARMTENDKHIGEQGLVYLPQQIDYLRLTHQFILTNSFQLISKGESFCDKVHKISEIFQKINHLTRINPQNQNAQQNITDTLSNYLPKQHDQGVYSVQQLTFSPRQILNLKENVWKNYNFRDNKHALLAAINVFQKTIQKITFDRICSCRRYNLKAAEAIFQSLRNSNLINLLLCIGLKQILSYSEKLKYSSKIQDEVNRKRNMRMMKEVFSKWKKIKSRKNKLLRILIRNKIKLQEKQKNLIFNRWRLNISRQRIQQKILCHSQSCASVVNRFTQRQIQQFNIKNRRNTSQKQTDDIRQMSQIGINKQSCSKGQSCTKNIQKSRHRIADSKHPQRKPDLKLLNYQYKKQIIQKLNRKTKQLKQKKSISMFKASSKTLIRI